MVKIGQWINLFHQFSSYQHASLQRITESILSSRLASQFISENGNNFYNYGFIAPLSPFHDQFICTKLQ